MYQKIIVIGNLGADPEMKYLPTGTAVCNFSIATTKSWSANGEKKSETTWFKVTVWGKQAEVANQYLNKGNRVLVEGEVKVEVWKDKNGNPAASMVITASNVKFLTPKDGQGGDTSTHVDNGSSDSDDDEPLF